MQLEDEERISKKTGEDETNTVRTLAKKKKKK